MHKEGCHLVILHEVSENEKPELHTVFAGAPCPHLQPPSQAHSLIHSIFLFLLLRPLERPNEAGAVVALLIYLCVYLSWLNFDTSLHPLLNSFHLPIF